MSASLSAAEPESPSAPEPDSGGEPPSPSPALSSRSAEPITSGSIYNRVFWTAYAANLCLVTANVLTFRFAEYVAWMGGTEEVAGFIVSVGGFGALILRLSLGQGIDRHGVRPMWFLSAFLFCLGCLSFVLVDSLGVLVYGGRIAFSAGLAGLFTCSIVHIQRQVPHERRTEVIGSLGSSGFVGMIIGSQLGDAYVTAFDSPAMLFDVTFGTCFCLGLAYAVIAYFLTRRDAPAEPMQTPSAVRLVFEYWPGPIVAVAMLMGTGFALTTVFLTRYATSMDLRGVGTFFSTYAVVAFTMRMVSRRWSQTLGRHPMVLIGVTSMTCGMLCFPMVSAEWHFRLPAVCFGFGHALLFPVVVSMGSGSFPKAYRGTGTTVVLGFIELGTMIAAPLLGRIIDTYGFQACFATTTTFALSVGCYYALTAARRPIMEPDADPLPTATRPCGQES